MNNGKLWWALCILIVIPCDVSSHFELEQDGRKFNWHEASQICEDHGGFLMNGDHGPLQQETEVQSLLNGSDTWTSLQLVNGYIQEVTTHTSYTKFSNKLWEENKVWNFDTCVKVTRKHELKAVKCSTPLPVVCQFEEFRGQVTDCVKGLPPILTVEIAGTSVNVEHGEINIRQSEKENVTFHCKSSIDMSAFDWIKDGVYINARTNVIYPAKTEDPSKLSNPYSIQGTYWCEAWIPGCANKYHSNKINLKFKGVATVHLNLKKEEIAEFNIVDILRQLKTLIPSHAEENILDFDMRRGYTPIGKQNVSTYNFNIYKHAYTLTDEGEEIALGRGNELSNINITDSTSLVIRKRRQNQPREECPPYFESYNSYCIRVTGSDTWKNAYEDCFRNGIEKTPLDVGKFWSNSSNLAFIEWLINKGVTSIWLAAERKVGGGPIYYSGPIKSDFNYSDYNAAEEFNITWKEQHYNASNRCMILNVRERAFDITSCEESLPFVCIFPLEFWTYKITYDSFYRCESACVVDEPITWRDARDNCKEKFKTGDLVYQSREGDAKKITNLYYSGRQNSQFHTKTDIDLEWFNSNVSSGSSLFIPFKSGFIFDRNDTKYFACVTSINNTQPGLYIKEKNVENQISINTLQVHEINLLFGIRCYLNGKLIKKSERASVVSINEQGYVFCEALSHLPIMLMKSNIILLDNPDSISFIFQIFISDQKYDFKLHDLTFNHNDSSVAYFQNLFKQSLNCSAPVLSENSPENLEKIRSSKTLLLNITENLHKSGIGLEFRIEIPGEINQLENLYNYVAFLLNSSECQRPYKNFTLEYLRDVKYCISEEQSLTGTTDCKSNITWTLTAVGTFDECIDCNKLLTRSCIGTSNSGAKWGNVTSSNTDSHFAGITTCNITNKSIRIALTKSLIASMHHNKFEPAETTDFIKVFEDNLFEREENSTNVIGNTSVTIYSTSLLKNVKGFYRKQAQTFKHLDEIDMHTEEIVAAVYLDLTNASVLITHFENHPVFPHRTNNYERLSSVVQMKVSNENNITYPIKIIFSLESDTKPYSGIICGFWNETTMRWETTKKDEFEGKSSNGLYNCTYYHMTCFSLLLHISENENPVISLISEIGCYCSLTGLGLVLVAILTLHTWRESNHDAKLLFSLSLSLFVMFLLVVVGVPQTSNGELCMVLGAFLHYFSLSSFCWMFAIAFHNYLKFVIVLGTYIPRFMWKASFGAWFIPTLPLILVICINPQYYKHKDYCWLHDEGFEYGFLLPLCLIVFSNVIIYIRILISVCKRMEKFPTRIHNKNPILFRQIILSLCLFVMFGLSWVFGLFAIANENILLSYLFCITASMQGFFIFVFFILIDKTAKEKLVKYICLFYKELQKIRFRRVVEECEQPLSDLN